METFSVQIIFSKWVEIVPIKAVNFHNDFAILCIEYGKLEVKIALSQGIFLARQTLNHHKLSLILHFVVFQTNERNDISNCNKSTCKMEFSPGKGVVACLRHLRFNYYYHIETNSL